MPYLQSMLAKKCSLAQPVAVDLLFMAHPVEQRESSRLGLWRNDPILVTWGEPPDQQECFERYAKRPSYAEGPVNQHLSKY